MNSILKKYGNNNYKLSKLDLFTMFMERGASLIKPYGYNAQVNMQAWMFLSSYEQLRLNFVENYTFISLAHLGTKAFSEIGGEIVKTVAWVHTHKLQNYSSTFIDCSKLIEQDKSKSIRMDTGNRHYNNLENLKGIPGLPFAYWVNTDFLNIFSNNPKMEEKAPAMQGLVTADNEQFVRFWHETDFNNISLTCSSKDECIESGKKWFLYNKGGSYRKWFGNQEHIVNWWFDGHDIKQKKSTDLKLGKITANNSKCWNQKYYFKTAISWSGISTDRNSFRLYPEGSIFSGAGLSAFFNPSQQNKAIGLLNSNLYRQLISIISPGHNLTSGEFGKFPYLELDANIENHVASLISIHKSDWDSKELSFEFTSNGLVSNHCESIKDSMMKYINESKNITDKTHALECELNDTINKSANIVNHVNPNVKMSEITLFSNILYRYSNTNDLHSLTLRYQSDLTSELISFAIGCMMGRYSLDREGLVYAHSGNNGFKELVAEGAYNTFPADDDGIIPLAAEEWLFEDDATTRFREFVKTVWGEEHLTENLDFVAESLCLDAIKAKKGEGTMDTIRRYFSTQFYKDHLKTYKKRPIYWLFSSGKEKAFECLVYLHRYNESTLARMRTEYVTPLMGKIETQLAMRAESINNAPSTTEKNRLTKELKSLEKKQAELRVFDEELKHLSEMKINLDLDDGVKVNYGKFGNLLSDVKDIHGKKPEAVK